jgi:hypothetical protein
MKLDISRGGIGGMGFSTSVEPWNASRRTRPAACWDHWFGWFGAAVPAHARNAMSQLLICPYLRAALPRIRPVLQTRAARRACACYAASPSNLFSRAEYMRIVRIMRYHRPDGDGASVFASNLDPLHLRVHWVLFTA